MFEIEETMKRDETKSILENTLVRYQKEAFKAYNKLETPSRINHLWKYTDPLHFEMDLSNGDGKQGKPLIPRYSESNSDDYDVEISIDGDSEFVIDLSKTAKEKGVIVKNLVETLEEDSSFVNDSFMSMIGPDYGKYEALNLYKLQAGIVVYVPDNIDLEKPVLIKRKSRKQWLFTRLLLVTGKNSSLTLVDEYSRDSEPESAVSSVVEVVAGENSQIKYATIQDMDVNGKLYLTQRNSLAKDSHLEHVTISMGSGVTKYNWKSYLDGQGADSQWFGMLMGSFQQHFDHHTSQHHRAGNTSSNMGFKVAVQDHAVSAYTGKIVIDEGAVNCEAFQENRNLILDESAKAESIPELEISNDDVKCSHGVTVGPLEQDQVFYLMSRGIKRDEAIKIILNGFFEAIYKRIPVEKIKNNTEIRLKAVMEGENG